MNAHPTQLSAAHPSASRTSGRVMDIAGICGFALLTALAARIAFPLPGTPVPMTLQTLVVLLCGVCLGPARSSLSQMLYLGVGAVGFPVFAADAAGPAYLFGATGGYLLAFVAVPVVVGATARRHPGARGQLLAAALGTVCIFAAGIGWLTVTTGSLSTAVAYGLTPFVFGAVLKWALAAALGRQLMPLCRTYWP